MYCNNPENIRRIWTWANCNFEERIRKWELPSKWYEHIKEFKKVFEGVYFQFPKQNIREIKRFKNELKNLFADFYLEPIFNNDYGNNCCLICPTDIKKLRNDCETRLLQNNEFYYSKMGQREFSEFPKALDHLREYFKNHYNLTPRYFVERYRLSEDDARRAKIDIYLLAKKTAPDYVSLVAHRELESKIQLQKDNIPYTITVIHKDFPKNYNMFEKLLLNPQKYESAEIKCQESWYEKDEKIDVEEETNQIVDVEYVPEKFLLRLSWIGARPVELKRCDLLSLNPSFWEISYSRI